jgi:hypothetical protein
MRLTSPLQARGYAPPARYEHGMTRIGGTLFVFGGYGEGGVCTCPASARAHYSPALGAEMTGI